MVMTVRNIPRGTAGCRHAAPFVSVALFSVPGPALAQESGTDALLQEVTVTARKREENIQDTPIAITAYSAASIEARGVTQIDQLAAYTPNLTYQNSPGYGGSTNTAAIYIRGIGQFDFLGSIEPGVGLYVDGVYVARSIGGIMDLVDVERLEILRGPQGTLFGRNTIGGAVSITSRKPGNEFEGQASATYGTDDRIDIKGSISGPLGERLFGKVSVASLQKDGYVSLINQGGRQLGDKDTLTAATQLRWEASDSFTADFSADYSRDRNHGAPFVLRGASVGSAVFNPGNLPLLPPGSPATPGFYVINPAVDVPTDNFIVLANYLTTLFGGPNCLGIGAATYDPIGNSNPACFSPALFEQSLGRRDNAGTYPAFSNSDIWGASLNLDWVFGDTQVVSIAAYRELSSEFQRDFDNTPLLIAHVFDRFDQWQVSEELQLKGVAFDDRLDWILGAYYFKENVDSLNIVQFPPATVYSGGLITNKSYAGFAQGTYALSDKLKLTAGLRYTKDSKVFDSGPYQFIIESRSPAFVACSGPTAQDCPVESLTVTTERKSTQRASVWTPYLNVAYDWSDDFMTYLSYSEGFKSGGFTQRVFPPVAKVPDVAPEYVTVYEAGFKLSALERRLRINGASFYTDYTDIQVQGFTAAGGVAPVYINGPKARMQGFELEVQAFPAQGWFAEASAGYLDDKYESLPPTVIGIDLHKHFERVSKWTLAAALQKDFTLGADGGSLRPRVDWAYRSKFYNDSSNLEPLAQPGYSVFNGSLTWSSASDAWSVAAGVSNLADKDYIITSVYNASLRDYSVVPARGREWYLTVRAKF